MNNPWNKLARAVSSPKGAKIVVAVWIIAIVILSLIAPGAKQAAVSSGEGSALGETPSEAAQKIMDERFPSEDGLTALLVFHGKNAITAEERSKIAEISEWLASAGKPQQLAGALPFHTLPKAVQDKMFSDDGSTVLLNAAFHKNLESGQLYEGLQQIRSHVEQTGIGSLDFKITGPAGIAADTTSLFKNADFVLMFATVGLILVILMIIYRSPLLAVIPLVISGMVYMVVDRILGLAGKYGWFLVDKQALSIMMILLFAVLTDYCLFVLARYREELKTAAGKYEAMQQALSRVAEPILFSGGTVLVAMLTLFTAAFKPYHHFAPVFSTAMAVILLGGLTLIPAVFALLGRKAFWPFVPKPLESSAGKAKGFWASMGGFVTGRPGLTAGILLLALLASSLSVTSMKYSFNLLKSFPDNTSSRQGFEILESKFPPGQLAPVTILLTSEKKLTLDATFYDKIGALAGRLKNEPGVNAVSPEIKPAATESGTQLPKNTISADGTAVKLQLTPDSNPYEPVSLDLIGRLRDKSPALLEQSGLNPSEFTLHYAGQTAEQLDVRNMNKRDTILLFTLITLFITVMLLIQTKSFKHALTMIATMLLSYTATLGLGWMIFHFMLGYDSISYRLPVYTFVFLIALGVDYNIMLVSRIKEEALSHTWKEAVSRGVALTGGVISSAGLILAATFTVLITQPLQELFLFGLTMSLGILLDTFLVRGMLLPALLIFVGDRKKSRIDRQAGADLVSPRRQN
ncbi:MMPL family transporter [Paenibacillus sp. UNC499MF]|uniref:MMPL family transporter n=1 Tax=Paenibacillus sp. UNC499MF TaxID=1502751 RepID=UPI00089F9295|nr:MMPL family transporter [Paenibacillus sp. UNC499MF]SEG66297.1 putative drug exporter of the RND superfamily [Paenibacillus sp. UNC499MF]